MPSNTLVHTHITITQADLDRCFGSRIYLSPVIVAIRRCNPAIHFVQWLSPRVVQLVSLDSMGRVRWHWKCRVPSELGPRFPRTESDWDLLESGSYSFDLTVL